MHFGQECSQQIEENHFLPLLCTCEIVAGVLYSIWGLPIEDRHQYTCMSLADGCHHTQWLKDMT